MDQLSPAARAVLEALAALGQGSVSDIRANTGKTRAATERAVRDLAVAGLIIPTDPGDGGPVLWHVPTAADAAPDAAPEAAPDAAPDAAVAAEAAASPPVDAPDGATGHGTPPGDANTDNDSEANSEAEAEPSDEASETDAGQDGRPASGHAADVTPPAQPTTPARPADRKVLIVAGVLGDYPAGTTVEVIADACGLGLATVVRLLAAMEQADAARRVPADPQAGTPELWQPGDGKASAVDPNPAPPRCATCGQVIRMARPRPAASADRAANSDGNEPLARNVLRSWVLDFVNTNPGRAFTPQDIATELSARHNRVISGGAVRNNCTTLAAAGQIRLASTTPQTFTANDTAADTATAP
jgi:hypothetical protein